MNRKKTLLLVIILIFANCALFASISYSPSIHDYFGPSFTFPTAKYLKTSPMGPLPAMRTSFNAGVDVVPAGFTFNNVEIGLGFSFLYNSRSLAAGMNFLQSYYGLGASALVQYNFNKKFSLGLRGRYLFCRYGALNNRFNILEAEVVPSVCLIDKGFFKGLLTCPVIASFKADSISVRVGVGFDVKFNVNLGGGHEK